MKLSKDPLVRLSTAVTVAFVVFLPLVTWVLIWLRGLPSFAGDHPVETLLWVYQVTWIPSLLGGFVVGLVLTALRPRWPFFIRPYDIGRCLSFGAILGALAEALATWTYRTLTHHLFSNFWIAGAMIAGCFVGAVTVSVVLYLFTGARSGRVIPDRIAGRPV